MTYLLLQTFLLLLASYFLGAFLACTAKRTIIGSRHTVPAHAGAPLTVDAPLRLPVGAIAPRPVSLRSAAPPVVPRPIDPVQPRIDVIRRPEPRPAPKLIDPSRFERALMGPDPNEGIPRRAIPEIRPVVLKPVTGAYQPGSYGPQPEPEPDPEPEIPPTLVQEIFVEPEPEWTEPPPPAADVEIETPPEPVAAQPQKPARLTARLSDATTMAAASAVAAAKAAAAASVMPITRIFTPVTAKEIPEPPQSAIEKHTEEPNGSAEEADEILADEIFEEPVEQHSRFEEPPPEAEELEPDVEEPSLAPTSPATKPQPVVRAPIEGGDDFQRIRAIDADIEQRLKEEGIDSFEHIAAWTPADVKRSSQLLGIPGRIDREQWVEQAQILAKGGETYYSRNRVAAQKTATPAERPVDGPVTGSIPAAPSDPDTTAGKSQSVTVPQSAKTDDSEEKSAVPAAAPDTRSETKLFGVAAAIHGRSVAEMASAAAAAIAAASASVTRGLKPIEPISPLAKANPKISMPAKLSDAIREKEAAAQIPTNANTDTDDEVQPPRPLAASGQGPHDDLKRIRGVGVLIEKRLNAVGILHYEQIANWTSGEIDRVNQLLEFKGRIEREGWVEQARILLNGGQTEFSRRVDRGEVDTSRET